MKAAVLETYGELPVYKEIAAPTAKNADEIVVSPIASSIKNLDKGKAAGRHYTDFGELPAIMGMDGVAKTADGQLIYAMGISGMMAEKAIVNKNEMIVLPENLNPTLAAGLPNALMGSDMALTSRGKIKADDVVLVNGATGMTGMLAVQMAKFHGASFVIATGRNTEKLSKLTEIGADLTIDLTQSDEQIEEAVKSAYAEHPFDIWIDYLWGNPAELIFKALSEIKITKALKVVTVGGMAGSEISLPSQILRSRDITIIGSGIGALTAQEIKSYMTETLKAVFDYAANHGLYMDLNEFPLSEITQAWQGNQVVVRMDQ